MSESSNSQSPHISQYKDTVRLPKTDFPMKGNLAQTEPKLIDRWKEQKIFQKLLEKNKNSKPFVLPDGPPYANAAIHIGHVLNKSLKDIVIKYKNMAGYKSAFVPGWDCHGLPIELRVTKELGDKRKELTNKQIRELCRKEATKWIQFQREQFVRLGVLADWENPYLTMDPKYEAAEIRVLAKIFENGILYRGEKPVYWCPALQTALAAAEVEYRPHKSPSIFVRFPVKDPQSLPVPQNKPTYFVIWTTTPWTLPANLAVAVNSHFDYGFYEADDGAVYILAAPLKESVATVVGKNLKEIGQAKGEMFEGLKALHPFLEQESLVVLGDHVTLEAGSGVVHTAPGHGLEDYSVGLKYNLPIYSPVDAAGRLLPEVKFFGGLKIWDANPKIVEHLRENGNLLAHSILDHSYPHNPRSKTPLIFKATPQWFIRMDDEKYPLRKMALDMAEKQIQFVPDWGKPRLTSMIQNTPDWCLSRQRIWGVPVPVFHCESCEETIAEAAVMNKIADAMEANGKGIEAYFDSPPEVFLGSRKCNKCGGNKFRHSQDILDVWFDSGVCHTAVQRTYPGMAFPADIYLEGSDQHRGWFQTSLLSSLAATGEAPYKALITHGFVNDQQGFKMSKSQGNTVDPSEIIKKNGAEILRLWVAYEDYGQDVSFSEEQIQRISETYRRIRNTLRFLLGNTDDFDPEKNSVPVSEMPPLDRWALAKLNALIENVTAAYESYEFYKVYHLLNQFFTVDLSATYLDVLKDRLYTWKQNGVHRRASQTVIHQILNVTVRLMAPILSFLAEESYGYLKGVSKESIFLEDFPKPNANWNAPQIMEHFGWAIELRSLVAKSLEELRQKKEIGSSLDASVEIQLSDKIANPLLDWESTLKELLIVSQLHLKKGGATTEIQVAKAKGEKCVRCWHFSEKIEPVSSSLPGICPKCVEALS